MSRLKCNLSIAVKFQHINILVKKFVNKKVRVMAEKEKNKGKKFSEIIFGDKYEPTDIENLSDEELRATRFVDGWTDEEIERIIKEWEKRGL